MFTSFLLTLAVVLLQQQPCQHGQVVEVNLGRTYTLDICGVGIVALRGVDPPLRGAFGLALNGPVSGDVLGIKDFGPDAINFMSELLVGKPVTLVADGWRIGDSEAHKFAYVFLSDKTLLNAELIRRGYGYASSQGSHPRRDEFRALEHAARQKRLGVWSEYP
jgi:endonuclease YncB( thermonuclease family)